MIELPTPVRRYFEAGRTLDVDAMLEPFAADARVRDEGKEHRGTEAIHAWIARATRDYQAVATPREVHATEDGHRVRAEVTGAFPGSPVMLTFDFRLSGDRISELSIG